MSKSLYINKDAYKDLPKSFINYTFLKQEYGIEGLDILLKIIIKWFDNPYMLFRHYTVYYFIEEFKKYE